MYTRVIMMGMGFCGFLTNANVENWGFRKKKKHIYNCMPMSEKTFGYYKYKWIKNKNKLVNAVN